MKISFNQTVSSPKEMPTITGVYAICVKGNVKNKYYYIGSSTNLYKRVNSSYHPYRKAVKEFGQNFVCIKFLVTDLRLESERKLIYKYKPTCNKIGKTKPKKKKHKFILCIFRPDVKSKLKSNDTLISKISKIMRSSTNGVIKRIDDDSQSIFHYSIMNVICEALKTTPDQITNCNP